MLQILARTAGLGHRRGMISGLSCSPDRDSQYIIQMVHRYGAEGPVAGSFLVCDDSSRFHT